MLMQNFYGHPPIEFFIKRRIHGGHASFSDEAFDSIAIADQLFLHPGHVSVLAGKNFPAWFPRVGARVRSSYRAEKPVP